VFLKCRIRKKDGKEHRTWSVVESRRFSDGKVAHRHVLYLGEINDSQREAWQRSIRVFDEDSGQSRQLALFPADRLPPDGADAVQVDLGRLRLERPRQWGACWLTDELWRTLHLDDFFAARLPLSREGTDWETILRILTIYRLLSPGSEWRLHRHWFSTTALPDLLGVDERAAQDDTLYRCLDLLLPHKEELFGHLRQRWSDLFEAKFEVLLYDLTSTCFECAVPADEDDPRRFGYSRDKRGDCVQVVVALVVTPDGLPLAYEMLPGNTADKTTLRDMLATIRRRYGQAERIEAHLFVAFLAYCLSITLRQQLRPLAPGLMPRVVLEKLAGLQLLDVIIPTTDSRELLLRRRTEPDHDIALLLDRLGRTLPAQPPPRIGLASKAV